MERRMQAKSATAVIWCAVAALLATAITLDSMRVEYSMRAKLIGATAVLLSCVVAIELTKRRK